MNYSQKVLIKAKNIGYRVTKEGDVYSPFSNKKIKLFGNGHGYKAFSVRLLGYSFSVPVHRLVAFQKYGNKIFEKGIQVRHLNGDSRDNSHDNISIGTAYQNAMDKPKEVRIRCAINAASYLKKYDYKKVKEYHKKNGGSYKKTMEFFDISSKGTLHYILNKKKLEKPVS